MRFIAEIGNTGGEYEVCMLFCAVRWYGTDVGSSRVPELIREEEGLVRPKKIVGIVQSTVGRSKSFTDCSVPFQS
jgi:hypothetical protein